MEETSTQIETDRLSETAPPAASRSPLRRTGRLEGLQILLAEDSPDNQYLVTRILEHEGARIELAENGLIAVDLALTGQHDVVLMDIQMPKCDGYQATEVLRLHDYSKPIFALTAHAFDEDRARCFAAGCNDHITKPINKTVLIEKLAEVLRAKTSCG